MTDDSDLQELLEDLEALSDKFHKWGCQLSRTASNDADREKSEAYFEAKEELRDFIAEHRGDDGE